MISSIYIYIYRYYLVFSQVVDTLKQLGDAPKPFAQSSQYKKNVKKAKSVDPDAAELAEVPSKGSSAKQKAKKTRPDVSKAKKQDNPPQSKPGVYQPNEYSRLRREFIDAEISSKGVAFSVAAKLWDASDKKKQLLGSLSLPELKRRRFITKDAESNPWSDA